MEVTDQFDIRGFHAHQITNYYFKKKEVKLWLNLKKKKVRLSMH